jgi:putative membrane protein
MQKVFASLSSTKFHFRKSEESAMRKNLSVLPLLAFSTLVAPLQAIAQTQQQPTAPPQNYYWPGPWHMMWGWGMFPMMLLFLVLFCVVAFFFARSCMGGMHRWGPSHPWGDPTHSALQILNERLAKGEIQKEEYNERKAAILSGAQR